MKLIGVEFLAAELADTIPPPSPGIVAAIRREFDPDFVPLIVRRIYKNENGSLFITERYVLARHVDVPRNDMEPLRILKHRGWPSRFRSGYIYESRTWETEDGEFQPFDGSVYHFMKATYHAVRSRERGIREMYKDYVKEHIEAPQERLAKVNDRNRQRLRDDRRQIKKAVDEGRFYAEPPPDPKPFVDSPKTIYAESPSA